jgi:hypothetical protein
MNNKNKIIKKWKFKMKKIIEEDIKKIIIKSIIKGKSLIQKRIILTINIKIRISHFKTLIIL